MTDPDRSEEKKDPHKDKEFEDFKKTVGGITDPILLILRMHLYTEHLLERIISCKLPRGDRHINDSNISYNQKLSLVSAFDYVPDEIIASLKKLNRVRNQCAHELHKEITISEVDVIGRPFGSRYTHMRRKSVGDNFSTLYDVFSLLSAGLAAFTNIAEEQAQAQVDGKKRLQK